MGTPWNPVTQSSSVASASTRSIVKTPYHFPRTLRQGLKGDDVIMLQKFLNIVPVSSKYFGLKTRTALIAYQVSHGLVGDGILGAQSRTIIEAELNK
jgi:peptidoglycan hydrolase-like protein with peptidoglycan-binding domain